MMLNMITTGAMTRLGYVYENWMVNVHMKNSKLVERGIGILMKAANVDRETADLFPDDLGDLFSFDVHLYALCQSCSHLLELSCDAGVVHRICQRSRDVGLRGMMVDDLRPKVFEDFR